jgi:hypothetical protein
VKATVVPKQQSYAYTKMTQASPIKSNPGGTNVPMTYAGPPTPAEIQRNKYRRDQSRSTIPLINDQEPTNIMVTNLNSDFDKKFYSEQQAHIAAPSARSSKKVPKK